MNMVRLMAELFENKSWGNYEKKIALWKFFADYDFPNFISNNACSSRGSVTNRFKSSD